MALLGICNLFRLDLCCYGRGKQHPSIITSLKLNAKWQSAQSEKRKASGELMKFPPFSHQYYLLCGYVRLLKLMLPIIIRGKVDLRFPLFEAGCLLFLSMLVGKKVVVVLHNNI